MVFLVVSSFLAGAVNAAAGGGSLITFPALLAVGLSPVAANVTSNVALVPGYLGGSLAYREELVGQGSRVRELGLVSVGGALVGGLLLLLGSESTFDAVVPFLILFSCVLLAVQPYLGRLMGKPQARPRAGRRTVAYRVGIFLAAVYGGYFGAGLGIMLLAVLGLFLQDGLQRLNALKGVLSLLINVVSGVYFALFGPVVWIAALVMAGGSLLGGQFGVGLARRLPAPLLRGVIVAFGALVALSLLFG